MFKIVDRMRVMISRVIVSQSEKEVEKYLREKGWREKLVEEIEAESGKVKIADLRKWLKKSFLKRKSGEVAVFLIKGADNLSLQCQNTLLKPLEEPEEEVVYVLTVRSLSKLLPTIVSRCVKIDLGRAEKRIIDGEKWQRLSQAWQGELAGCVELIEDLSREEDVGLLLQEVMEKLEIGLRKWPSKTRVKMAQITLDCYRGWQLKVNKKLILGKLILEGWALINLDN